MKKSMILLFGLIFMVSSCIVSKKTLTEDSIVSEKDSVRVSVDVIYVVEGEEEYRDTSNDDDTTLYNTYRILHLETGQFQYVSYASDFNLWSVKDSTKIKIVDTVKCRVLWKEL